MAYLVSQLRKNGSQTYMENVQVSPSTITSPNTFGGDTTFTDFALAGSFTSDNVYYLRFQIHKIPQYFYSGSKTAPQVSMYQDADDLKLQILLKNNNQDETNNPPEIIGTCSVPRGSLKEVQEGTNKYYICDEYSSYSFVFSPSKSFNRLGFRINRISYDAINALNPRNWLYQQEKIKESDEKIINSDGTITISGIRETGSEPYFIKTTGPRIKFSNQSGDVCTLNNLVNQTSGWTKIGYQCRPGSLVVVNGEPIRLGRSGIYEINNGTIINSFMIASPRGSNNKYIDAFLLDYAYKS